MTPLFFYFVMLVGINEEVWLRKNHTYFELPNIGKRDGLVFIRPKGITTEQMIQQLGKPLWTRKVVILEEGGSRPLVLMLYGFSGLVGVESNLSSKPGELVLILLKAP